jgi:hypothetical protein
MAPTSTRRSIGIVFVSLLAGLLGALAILRFDALTLQRGPATSVAKVVQREQLEQQLDDRAAELDAAAPDAAALPATGERLTRVEYQAQLDRIATSMTADMTRYLADHADELDTMADNMRVTAEAFEPVVETLRGVRPPLDAARGHAAMIASLEAYHAMLVGRSKDPALKDEPMRNMSAELAATTEVQDMNAAAELLREAGYRVGG